MLSKIQEINQAIMFGTWTDTELASMVDAIKFARQGLRQTVKRSLQLGTQVKYLSTKQGCWVRGEITKIAQKYATVRSNGQLWRVPMNMLEVV